MIGFFQYMFGMFGLIYFMIGTLIILEYFHSKCEGDYKGKHFWEKLGIIFPSNVITPLLVWRCSQCGKCVKEELEFISQSQGATK